MNDKEFKRIVDSLFENIDSVNKDLDNKINSGISSLAPKNLLRSGVHAITIQEFSDFTH